jgi:D-alanine-D-alanine ligase
VLNVGILYGGRSDEHDVSRCSAASVVSAIDRNRYNVTAIGIDRDGKWYVQDEPLIIDDADFGRKLDLKKNGTWYINHFEDEQKLKLYDTENGRKVSVDIVFPVMHGTYCEDGTLQGLLELSMVPYVGADITGSVIGMDKDVAKRLLRDSGISVVPWVNLNRSVWETSRDEIILEAEKELGYPMFVKPAASGSSVGIKKASSSDQLTEAVEYAFSYDLRVLIEKAIDAREIECAVLGNSTPSASVLGEIIPRHEFYSYEAKYIDDDGAELVIPADVEESLSEVIRSEAVKAYTVLNCIGMARVDFFLERRSKEIYLNEINTLPGFTSISMYPKLWDFSGIGYSDLISKLIEFGLERHRELLEVRNKKMT